MKKVYKKSKFATWTSGIATALFLLFANSAWAFPGGTYTIDRNAAASATNYLSFTAFANDLRNITRGDGGSNNYSVGGAGVQGPITVNVVAGSGPYTERMQLTQITGVNATNTVTINGNSNVIQYANTAAGQGTIEMNGTDYFRFYNLEVSSTNQSNTGARCFWIYNSANFNIIRKCNLRTTYAYTTQGSAYIWMSNSTSTSPYTYSDAGNDNLIDSCDMSSPGNTTWGPYHGIVTMGNTSRSSGNNTNRNTVSNSTIKDFYLYGIFSYYSGGFRAINNKIHNTGITRYTTKYGLYTYYTDFEAERNHIYNLNGDNPQGSTQYGVYLYSFNSSGWVFSKSIFRNNIVHLFGTGTMYNYFYIYGYYGHVLDIQNNTLTASHPTANHNGTAYLLYGGYWQGACENNIVHYDLGGTSGNKQLVYDFNPQYGSYRNNNFFYGSRTSGFSTKYFGPNWQQNTDMNGMYGSGMPTNNISFDPEFVDVSSNSVIIPTSIPMANKGRVISGLTTDIFGVTRSGSTPDIGAVEYTVDLQITDFPITFPNPTCAGLSQSISGTVRNNGIYPIRNPRVAYKLNSRPDVVYTVPATIPAGGSVSFTFPTPQVFSDAGANTITLKIATPDDVPSNDAMSVNFTVTPAPGGSVFTKDPGSAPMAHLDITGKPDRTTYGQSLIYDVTPPSGVGYTNANYPNDWTYSIDATIESNGNPVASGIITPTAPSGATNLKINVTPDIALRDQTILMNVTITNLATGCDTVFKRKILVPPQGEPDFVVPSLICDKDAVFMDNISSVSSGYLEYEWTVPDATPSTADAKSPVFVFNGPGYFPVTLKTTTVPYGYENTKTIWVTVNDIPEASFANINACEGTAVRLVNNSISSSGGMTFTWDYGDNSAPFNTSSLAAINKLYPAPGGYRVTLVASANGCQSTFSKNVYQFAKPVANFSQTAGSCENEMFEFTNSSTISIGQFGNVWDFNDAGSKATLANPTYDFTSAGTKNVKLKVVSEFGCTDSITKPVIVKPAPMSDFSYPFACSRTATPFMNNTVIPGGTSATLTEWDFGDGTTTTASAPVKNWTSVGPKIVTLKTNLNNGCSDMISKEVNVGVQPNVSFNVQDQCSGNEAQFTNMTTYPQGNITYTWSFGDNQTSNIAQPRHTYPQATASQSYTAKLVASIQGGCADSAVKTITINPLPTACNFNLERDYTTSITAYKYSPVGTASGVEFTWLTGDGNSINTTGAGTSYSYSGLGKYCVTMIARNSAGCECSTTKCVTLTTDINSPEALNNAINLYPNPNTGVFNVSLDNAINETMVVKVYNMLGELVTSIDADSNNVVIDLSNQASGVYMVSIMVNNQIINKQVTVTR